MTLSLGRSSWGVAKVQRVGSRSSSIRNSKELFSQAFTTLSRYAHVAHLRLTKRRFHRSSTDDAGASRPMRVARGRRPTISSSGNRLHVLPSTYRGAVVIAPAARSRGDVGTGRRECTGRGVGGGGIVRIGGVIGTGRWVGTGGRVGTGGGGTICTGSGRRREVRRGVCCRPRTRGYIGERAARKVQSATVTQHRA